MIRRIIKKIFFLIACFALGIFLGLTKIRLPFSGIHHLIFFFIFIYFNIYIHELGHVIMALLVKFKIKKVTIGTGREIFKKKIFGITLIITKSISGGYTYLGKATKKLLKLRFAIFIFGGILFQVIAILLTYFFISKDSIYFINSRTILYSHVFVFSNVIMIIENLIPRRINYHGIKIPNDALQLIKIPFMTKNKIQDILSAGKIMDGLELYENRHYKEAELLFDECTKLYPDAIIPKINLSATYIKQLKFKKAINYLESILLDLKKDKYISLIYCNLAAAYLSLYNKKYFYKVDEYSEKAYNLNKINRSIISIRSCFLIESGKVDEGIRMLNKITKIYRKIDRKINKPVDFIYLAYGYYLKNNTKNALRYIKKVKEYYKNKKPDNDDLIMLKHVMKKTKSFNGEFHV